MIKEIATAVLTAGALFAVPGAANSADIYGERTTPADAYSQPYTAPAKNWTGIWLGAVGGLNFFNTETDYTHNKFDLPSGDFIKNKGSINIDGLGAEGLFGEIQAGFDKQIGQRTVVGIFGGFNMTDAEFSASFGSGGETFASVSSDYDWGSVLGLRAGILKSPDTLFYIAAGWAHAELGDVSGVVGSEAFTIAGPTLDGYFGEVGMETKVSDNLYLTVAGRWTDYGKETLFSDEYTHGGENGHKQHVETIEVDTDALEAMIGLKMKLGNF